MTDIFEFYARHIRGNHPPEPPDHPYLVFVWRVAGAIERLAAIDDPDKLEAALAKSKLGWQVEERLVKLADKYPHCRRYGHMIMADQRCARELLERKLADLRAADAQITGRPVQVREPPVL